MVTGIRVVVDGQDECVMEGPARFVGFTFRLTVAWSALLVNRLTGSQTSPPSPFDSEAEASAWLQRMEQSQTAAALHEAEWRAAEMLRRPTTQHDVGGFAVRCMDTTGTALWFTGRWRAHMPVFAACDGQDMRAAKTMTTRQDAELVQAAADNWWGKGHAEVVELKPLLR